MDLLDDPAAGNNSPEFSVTEISGAIKRVIEGEFGHVRIRGEVGTYRQFGQGDGRVERLSGKVREVRRRQVDHGRSVQNAPGDRPSQAGLQDLIQICPESLGVHDGKVSPAADQLLGRQRCPRGWGHGGDRSAVLGHRQRLALGDPRQDIRAAIAQVTNRHPVHLLTVSPVIHLVMTLPGAPCAPRGWRRTAAGCR